MEVLDRLRQSMASAAVLGGLVLLRVLLGLLARLRVTIIHSAFDSRIGGLYAAINFNQH